MDREQAVVVQGISQSYATTKAVDDLSFEVRGGEIFGLLGPNGAGKTTSIRMILDIIKPDSGVISVLCGRLDEAKKSRIGYLPEERGPYDDMTLADPSERVYVALQSGREVAEGPGLIVHFALGGFALYAGVMAGVGVLSSDLEGSRAWVFVLTLPMLLPIYFWSAIAGSPNGPVATALSLFPFSASVAMLMRMTSTALPAWQLGLSLLLLVLSGAPTVLVMARLLRVQTLLSGESFSLARAWSALTG